MTNCNFSEKCDINCPKYSMCSHYYIETQLSEIQKQIGTIYTTISSLVIRERRNEELMENVVALVNTFSKEYDSEMKKNKIKESCDEKDN